MRSDFIFSLDVILLFNFIKVLYSVYNKKQKQ